MTDGTRLPSGQTVYDPRGSVTAGSVTLADRLAALDGARLGVLDNSKWNASTLLRKTIGQLQETNAIGEVVYYTKDSFSRVAPPALIREIAEHADAVLTAVGD